MRFFFLYLAVVCLLGWLVWLLNHDHVPENQTTVSLAEGQRMCEPHGGMDVFVAVDDRYTVVCADGTRKDFK